MKSFGKLLTIATMAVGIGLVTAPNASACGSCGAGVITQPAIFGGGVISQPAVFGSSLSAPLLDNTLVQPAVIGATGCSSCADTMMVQPAVLAPSCGSCGTTLVQPAVLDNGCGVCGPGFGYGNGWGFRRHHLFGGWW